MSHEISLASGYSLTSTGNKPTPTPMYASAKKLGRFFVYTVPALLALITAKAGADVVSV